MAAGSHPAEASGGLSGGVLIITQTDGAGMLLVLTVTGEEAALVSSQNSLCFNLF